MTDVSSLISEKLASAVRQAAEISKILDSTDEFPKLGVDVRYLIAWHQDLLKSDAISLDATTTDVCEQIVKPLTLDTNLSFAELTLQRKSEGTAMVFGVATHFISHAWKYKFCDLVAALEIAFNALPKEEQAVGKTYFWVDLFAVDQHHACFRPHHWWATTFVEAIRSFGKVILVFQPFLDPIPLQRAWCLWEIFSAIKTKAVIELAMPTEQWTEFRLKLCADHISVLNVVSGVDARKADAFNPLDKAAIFEAIELEVGFDNLNQFVRNKIAGILLCGAARESSKDGNYQRVVDILDAGADIDTVATHLTPLGAAADMNCLPLVTVLLGRGANVNCAMGWGHTPLHLACRGGHATICKALLVGGADVTAVNAFGRTPLQEIENVLKSKKNDTISTITNSLVSNAHDATQTTVNDATNDATNDGSIAIGNKSIIDDNLQEQLDLLNAAIEGALSALNQLKKSDVDEGKAMMKPPASLAAAVMCTCLLSGITPNEKSPTRDQYWNTAKRKLFSNSSFLVMMKDRMNQLVDLSNCSNEDNSGMQQSLDTAVLSEAIAITEEEAFHSEALKRCSNFAWALGIWCRAVIFGLQLRPIMLEAKSRTRVSGDVSSSVSSMLMMTVSDNSQRDDTIEHNHTVAVAVSDTAVLLSTDLDEVLHLEQLYHDRCRECLTILQEFIARIV